MKKLITTISSLSLLFCAGSSLADILHYDDVIVTGSHCVGFDCVNAESFGYSTIKLKENNLQIEFNDTSVGSFPTNDWKIQINDTTSGGASYFTLWDVDAGRRPFTIEAGAPAHSLYVEDYGRVGLGTSIPYVELHIVDGDSPTIRLDQDGSSGWTAQRWDITGNETNFFIRDVTHGSKLTVRIQPDAPSNSLTIRDTGYVGIGTWSPEGKLHLEDSGDVELFLNSTGGTQAKWSLKNQQDSGRFQFTVSVAGATTRSPFKIDDLASNNLLKLGIDGDPDKVEINGDLDVSGAIVATTVNGTPDYVFKEDYKLMPLKELQAFVKKNHHLPEVPSEKEVTENGLDMTSMQLTLLKKVEELTLYTLEQQKIIDELQLKLASLEQNIPDAKQ